MAYLTPAELRTVGFKSIGNDVLVSTRAAIYGASEMEIGPFSRIDDFCLLSGRISIGRNVHITAFCNLAGAKEGVVLDDFVTLAYGCHVFTRTDDYSGRTMTNSTVPEAYKDVRKRPVRIGRHSIVGTGSIIFPGVELAEGTAIGAAALVTRSTDPWWIYVGIPAKKLRPRDKGLVSLEHRFEKEGNEAIPIDGGD